MQRHYISKWRDMSAIATQGNVESKGRLHGEFQFYFQTEQNEDSSTKMYPASLQAKCSAFNEDLMLVFVPYRHCF